MKRLSPPLLILLSFVAIKVLVHLLTANGLGFQRDEFLYLALGRHLDWGYWSNPPFIGLVGWFTQTCLGDSLFATRLPSALAGGALLWLTGSMVQELGGGRFAQWICGLAMLFSVAWLRAFSMLQPVPFDILCWTILSFLTLKWLKTGDTRWWWWIGAAAGIGFLIKYTLVFWAAAFFLALLLTPQRRVLLTPAPWKTAGVAVLLILPNLLWQWHYNFPVKAHMEELAREQLTHVQPLNFLVDQLLMQGPAGVLIWLAGLIFLLLAPLMKPYRFLGWFYVSILLIFLVLNGKSYYTLGAYPVLTAAGAVYWERALKRNWSQVVLTFALLLPGIFFFPTGIPVWPTERLSGYFKGLTEKGIEATRWEDGKLHDLPQDYADMLGWDELVNVVDSAVTVAGSEPYVIYGENYGQAGAVCHLRPEHRAHTYSFADSYRLWAPEHLPNAPKALIYINDEIGDDVKALFASITEVGAIRNPLAIEYGTKVWLCREPRSDMSAFWAERVQYVRRQFGIPMH